MAGIYSTQQITPRALESLHAAGAAIERTREDDGWEITGVALPIPGIVAANVVGYPNPALRMHDDPPYEREIGERQF